MSLVIAAFARAPSPGACKTRLIPTLGAERAADLYAAMLRDTLGALSELPAARRVLLAAADADGVEQLRRLAPQGWEVRPQRGADLSARLQAAVADFTAGGNRVLIVGTDAPLLPLEAIRQAMTEELSTDQVLLGAAEDGGYYLIALAADLPGVFADVPWSTDRVADVTRQRCRALDLRVVELPPTFDVDLPADLDRLRRELERDPTAAPTTAAWLRHHSD